MQKTEYLGGLIQCWDRAFTPDQLDGFLEYSQFLGYSYGRKMGESSDYTGMTSTSILGSQMYHAMQEFLAEQQDLTEFHVHQTFVNLFKPREPSFYHRDSITEGDRTAVLYLNRSWQWDQQGETRFLLDRHEFQDITQDPGERFPVILALAPIPGRIVLFESTLWHSATSFVDSDRFTAAIQYRRAAER